MREAGLPPGDSVSTSGAFDAATEPPVVQAAAEEGEDPVRQEFRQLTQALKQRPRCMGSMRSLYDWCQAMTQRIIETDESGCHRLSPLGVQILQDMLLLFAENQAFMNPLVLSWIETTVLPCLGTSSDAVRSDLGYGLLKLLLQRATTGTTRTRGTSAKPGVRERPKRARGAVV